MKTVEKSILPFLEQQFPSFYRDDGARFILFVKAYYEWLQSEGQSLNVSRNIFTYKDVDQTIDQFLLFIKEKYLYKLPLFINTNDGTLDTNSQKLAIKHSLDLYRTKGTPRHIDLLFRLLYSQSATVYNPGEDIFKLSDGTWTRPIYLELSNAPRLYSLIGKFVTGLSSGATAFVDRIALRRVKGRYIHVAYLSSLRGNFIYGEKIVDQGSAEDAPTIVGSLTTLDIVEGGRDNTVGDIFTIHSDWGKQGRVKVAAVSSETGVVNFKIIYGGFGYSLQAQTFISTKVLRVTDVRNANSSVNNFLLREPVHQDLIYLTYDHGNSLAQGNVIASNLTSVTIDATTVTNGPFAVGSNVAIANGSTMTVATANVESVTNVGSNVVLTFSANVGGFLNGYLAYQPTSNADLTFKPGDFVRQFDLDTNALLANGTVVAVSGTTILSSGELWISPENTSITYSSYNTGAPIYSQSNGAFGNLATTTDKTAVGYLTGSNTTAIGLDTVTNDFFAGEGYTSVYGVYSNTYANVAAIGTGVGATFKIGTIGFPESGFYNTDYVRDYLTKEVDANPTPYGFPKLPTANLATILADALTFEGLTYGTIASLTAINRGSNYNMAPFVYVIEPITASMNKYDTLLEANSNVLGFAANGSIVTQSRYLTGMNLQVTGAQNSSGYISYITPGDIAYQSNGTANVAWGYVVSTDLDTNGDGYILVQEDITGFTLSNTVYFNGVGNNTFGAANAFVIGTYGSFPYQIQSRGFYDSARSNSSHIFVRRATLFSEFVPGVNVFASTGVTAGIKTVTYAYDLPVSGVNADISANVQTANNVATKIQVIDSGYGYIPNEEVTLINENNPYVITALTNITNQGIGEGYSKSTKGFLSADKYLFDGEYYQEYSYEVRSGLPLNMYADVLKQLSHVAGTKMFGRVLIEDVIGDQIDDTSGDASVTDEEVVVTQFTQVSADTVDIDWPPMNQISYEPEQTIASNLM